MLDQMKTWLVDPALNYFRNGFSGFGEKFTTDLFEALVIVAILGAYLHMSGSKTWGRRLAGGSILAGLLCKVVFSRV